MKSPLRNFSFKERKLISFRGVLVGGVLAGGSGSDIQGTAYHITTTTYHHPSNTLRRDGSIH